MQIQYSQVLELVEQLTLSQQQDLIVYLVTQRKRQLEIAEKLQLLEEMQLDHAVNETPSVRRVDWYDDDGR